MNNRAVSIWDALDGGPKVDGAMRRAGELRRDIDKHEKTTLRLFERIRMSQAETEQAGAPVTQRLSPVLSAAYGQWLTGQDVPKRIELTELSEAPLPPEDDDAG